jgi:hypothetical protein
MQSPIDPEILLRKRLPRINCIHYDEVGNGRCNHTTGKAFFGKLPCILITNDSRIGSCKFMCNNPKPPPPPAPPPKRR